MKLTDEEKEQQAAIDVQAANERLARLNLSGSEPAAETQSEGQQPGKKRNKRKDAGQPRKAKPADPQPGGLLTNEQKIHLCILLEDIQQADRSYWAADAARTKAGIAYNDYLESITQK